jgi:hypothetical protein
MTPTKAAPSETGRRNERLDHRYGKIGIPAVAAALPYSSDAKNPVYAPVVHQLDKWLEEITA